MGQNLSVDPYMAVCRATNADPTVGMCAVAFASLYARGMADLDKDYDGLQDELDMMAYEESTIPCKRHTRWRPGCDECRAYNHHDRSPRRKGGIKLTRGR